MRMYLGINKLPILNGEYKTLRSKDYTTELVSINNFRFGKFHGPQYRLDKEGIIVEITTYENGELIETKSNVNSDRFVELATQEAQAFNRTGRYIQFAQNETSIFSLENGKFDGPKWIFNDDERKEMPILLSVENFKANHHLGEQVFFHEDGKIMLIEYYQQIFDSIPEKSTWFDYDDEGNLISEKNFRNNKKDGKHIYYENGIEIKSLSYKAGKLFGPSIYHQPDGTILEIDYEYGYKVGERIK